MDTEANSNNANIELIRSHVDTIILRSLLNEDKYGLEILNEITEKSKGLYSLKQPTLYSCLKRLEKIGYIRSYKGDTSNGAQRVYYSLLELGRNYVTADQYQWEFSRTIMDQLLSDKEFDPNTQQPPFDPSEFRPLTRRQPRESAPVQETVQAEPEIRYVYVDRPVYVQQAPDSNPFLPQSSYRNENADMQSDSEQTECAQEVNGADEDQITDTYDAYAYTDEEPIYEAPVDTQQATTTQATLDDLYDISAADDDDSATYYRAGSDQSFQEVASTAIVEDEDASDALSESPVSPQDETERYVQESIFSTIATEESPVERVAHTQNAQSNVPRETDPRDFEQVNVNYISSFDAIYTAPQTATAPPVPDAQEEESEHFDFLTVSEMKGKFAAEGFLIKPYVKKETTAFYSGKYFYSNKLLFHTAIMFYVSLALQLILTHALGHERYHVANGWLAFGLLVPLIYPIVCGALYFTNPNKRKQARFQAKNAWFNSWIVIVNFVVIILLFGYFAFRADFSDPSSTIMPIVVPIVLLANIPIDIGVYSLLYHSKRYHIN